MKVKKFLQLIESSSSINKTNLNRIDLAVIDVIDFLKDNNIHNWTEFTTSGRFDRWVVDKIIDSNCEDKKDLNEFRYKLKLKLMDSIQLNSLLKEYEDIEEFERCSEIQKEIERKKPSK